MDSLFLVEKIPTANLAREDRRNSTAPNKIVQTAIEETLEFVWIKHTGEGEMPIP